MKWIPTIFAASCLALAPFSAAQSLPPVVERYEQLLVRSPGKGTAFDKVYQHFFEGEGLEKLAARWTAQAESPGADAATYGLLLGLLAERQGKAAEAIRLYQKAAGLKPAEARIWSALGDAQAAAGNLPEAIKALQNALASNPTRDVRPQLFRQLARSQQRAFDGEGALKTWQQFVAESPEDPFVIEEAADAMAEVERFADAKAQYEKLRDLAGTDPYRRVTAIMKLAQLEEKQGRREPARALYESALPLASPTSWMHREVRARIEESYRRQDDLPGLAAYYEAWLKKQAKDVDVALRLSDALLELNRKTEAVTWLRQASEWAPDRKEVQVALAKRLGEIDQPQEAVAILTKLTQAHPEEESFREFLGDAHWQVFKTTKDEAAKKAAIESWRQLAPATTKDANKVSRVADLLRARELSAEALEHYARAVKLAPDVPELRQRSAEYLFELKRDDEGMQVLRDMVAGERATAPNFLRLARLQQRRQDLAGALDSVDQGLAKEPANFELLMVQWRLFSETEKWEQAAGLFERLLAAAPSVYSVDQVEDQQVQALRGLGRLDEVSKQLAGRIGKEPALTEAELRLLLRIALQSGDLETAGEAIADAKQRFPASAALVRRQVEYEKRQGNLDGRVAALQRLVELQPKQRIEWLREIVRAYQDEGMWDKALTAAQRVIEEAPASPDSYLLASDLNFAAQRFEAGVVKLREAIKLSDKPNDLRLRLARAFLDAGRGEEARQTFDAVFEAENDPKTRLALTRQLAEVYLQQGKLDELIGRFRQRQRAEEAGWRYALYLAEIFQQMQDFTAAREELSKALGARSRDGNFLRQLAQLSEAEGNTMESARFARLLAEAEPSEAHQIDLAEALLNNGETEEALKVLRANEDGFLKNPIAWREALLKFHSAGAGAALAETLRTSLERRAADWRGRLTLAELQLGLGDWAGAERGLWEILAMPPEAPAPAAPSAAASANAAPRGIYAGGGFFSPGAPGNSPSKYLQRMQKSYELRQNLAQILAGPRAGMRGSRYSSGRSSAFGGATAQPSLGSLAEARDAAIIYLATLAQQQDRGETFLQELEKRLPDAPRAERIVTYGLVQARDLLRREMEIEAAQPSGDADLDTYCFQVLVSAVRQEARQKSGDQRELALIETFLQRERRPAQVLTGKMTYYHVLTQAGRTEEAKKLADGVLAEADSVPVETLPVIFGFAIQREAFAVAEKALPRLVAASQQPGQSALKQQISWYRFSLASGLLQKKETVGRGVQLLAGMLQESYPAQLPTSLAALSPYARRSYRSAWREGQQFPYPNRYFDNARIQMWRQVFDRLKTADALGELKEELNRHIQSLPDSQTIFTQLARACFWWWDGAKGDAIREVSQLARELKDDDLRMMVSAMLAEVGQPAEALQALEQVTATSGDLAIDKQVRMLALARSANDLDRAKAIALTLAGQRLDANDESQLINALRELGLQEKLEELNKRRAGARAPASRNRIEDQLQQQVNAKNEKEAVALARAILARDPIATMRQGEDYQRQQALGALRTFKNLDAYRAELEKQLAEAPSSVRTVYLLAEAHGREDSAKALGYYRKLVELKPTDTAFQLQLATLLANNKQPEEAMRIWEALLARDPEPVMQNSFSQLVETYSSNKQMARLGAALLKLPKRPAALTNMAIFGGGQDYGSYFNQVAGQLQREGKTAEAIQVWRVALAQTDERRSGNQWAVLNPLVSALVEVGDHAGAAMEIERYFFPEVKPKALFGFDSAGPVRSWLQVNSFGNGRVELAATGLLRLAGQAGALDRLRTKAVTLAAEGNETDGLLVLLIDAQRRDAAKLDDLAARARGAIQRANERRDMMSFQVLQCLAQELREWPEGRRLALELMLGVNKGFDRLQNDSYQVMLSPQAAELAAELGETETARGVLREWQADVQRQMTANRYGYDYRQLLPVMDLMARVGLRDETSTLLKTVKSSPQWKNDSSARQKFEEFENRLALLAGGTGRARVAVWAVPPAAKDAPGVICWEIGPAIKARRNDSSGRGLAVSGEELPALDGRYELELFHGPTPSSMRKLSTLPAAKARGSWTSPTPLAAGYVLAVAREKASVLFSSAAYVATGPNLIVNPQLSLPATVRLTLNAPITPAVPGWPGLGASGFAVRLGGPRPGGNYVSLQPLQRSGRETITAQRIPIEAGKEYLLSGWLRYALNSGSARLTGRFYDKDGKPLDQIYSGSDEGDRWVQTQRWLVRARGPGGAEQMIPAQAVEIEIMVEASAGCDVDGLYFGEIPRGSVAPVRGDE